MRQYSLFSALDSFLAECEGESLVVVFINSPYLPLFDRWHACFRRCCEIELLVVSLDEEAHLALRDRGISTVLLSLDGFAHFLSEKTYCREEISSLASLWRLRTAVFQRVLHNGINLIHSDADAFWLDNPLTILNDLDHDLIASRAHGHPRELVKEWGFIVCMGFFVLKSTPGANQLMDHFAKASEEAGDDQVAMNRTLYAHNVTWDEVTPTTHEARIDTLNLTVRLLSDTFVSRPLKPGLAVWHPFLVGGIEDKILQVDNGLHKLRESAGLKLSYDRRNPIAKTGKSNLPFVLKHSKFLGLSIPSRFSRDLLFVHIPKAGGTSIQNIFSLKGRGHLRILDIEGRLNAYSFAVCRNPYSRLVSAFHYLTDKKNLPEWDHAESAYVWEYRYDFKLFVKEVVASFDIYRSIHLIPQTFFICEDSEILVNKVISLEDFDACITPICSRFGVDYTPIKRNTSNHGSIAKYYDQETRSIVSNVYEKDFRVLGYDPLGCLDCPPVIES